MFNENLKRILRDEIACYDAMLSTTPHLSRIHHAEAARPPPAADGALKLFSEKG